MRLIQLLPLLFAVPMTACQVSHHEPSTRDLDGVWQGALATTQEQQALTGHMLDGLMLSMHLDGPETHSAEVVLDAGQLAGLFVRRNGAGVSEQEYTLLGEARAYDRISASLLSEQGDADLDLFYDHWQSEEYLHYASVSGLYHYHGADLQVNLAIDEYGVVEGYDDSGCAYFGQVDIPDPARNVFAMSLSVDGCALAGDYGYGIGSLVDEAGWSGLDLPIWFVDQGRVEAWRMLRI